MYQRRCLFPLLLLFAFVGAEALAVGRRSRLRESNQDCYTLPTPDPKTPFKKCLLPQDTKCHIQAKIKCDDHGEVLCPQAQGQVITLKIGQTEHKDVCAGFAAGKMYYSQTPTDDHHVPHPEPCQLDQADLPPCEITDPQKLKCFEISAEPLIQLSLTEQPRVPDPETEPCSAFAIACPKDLQGKHGTVITRQFGGQSTKMCLIDGVYVLGGFDLVKSIAPLKLQTLGLNQDKSLKKSAEENSALPRTFRQTIDCWNALHDLTLETVDQTNLKMTNFMRLLPLYRKALEVLYVKSSGMTTFEATATSHFRAKIAHMVRTIMKSTDWWLKTPFTDKTIPISLADVGSKFKQAEFYKKVQALHDDNLKGTCRLPFFLLNSMTAGLEFRTAASKQRWDNFKKVAMVIKLAGNAVGTAFSIPSGGASKMGSSILNSLLDSFIALGEHGVAEKEYHRAMRLTFVDYFQSLMLETGNDGDTEHFKEVALKKDCSDVFVLIKNFYLKMFPAGDEDDPKVTEAYKLCTPDASRFQAVAKAQALMTVLKSFITLPALGEKPQSWEVDLNGAVDAVGDFLDKRDGDKSTQDFQDKVLGALGVKK